MSLEKTILRKLAETPPVASRQAVSAGEGEWTVKATCERRDEFSALFWELELTRASPGPGDVRAWASRVASNSTGLLEPLKVLEIDGSQDQAILRSVEPTQRDEQLYYYELNLRGTTHASLRRFQGSYQAGQKRTQVPFALTLEALGKLVGDIAE